MTKPIVVKTTLFWANTNTINDLSQKYQVNLGQLSEKAVEALQANGIDVKNKGDEQGFFITTKSANPIRAVDADGLPIVGNIGNGSEARAAVSFYDWTYQKKSGRAPSLQKLVVDKLVEYGDDAGIDDLEVL